LLKSCNYMKRKKHNTQTARIYVMKEDPLPCHAWPKLITAFHLSANRRPILASKKFRQKSSYSFPSINSKSYRWEWQPPSAWYAPASPAIENSTNSPGKHFEPERKWCPLSRQRLRPTTPLHKHTADKDVMQFHPLDHTGSTPGCRVNFAPAIYQLLGSCSVLRANQKPCVFPLQMHFIWL
jgi:hypothetical protein